MMWPCIWASGWSRKWCRRSMCMFTGGSLTQPAHLFELMNLPWKEFLCGHRISISCFEPLGIKALDKQYAARAIEEWLCFEAEHIENAKTLEELI